MQTHNADPFSSPLNDLVEHINPLLEDGRALSLNKIFLVYQGHLQKCTSELSVLAYTTHKLEENLEKKYKDKTVIQNQNNSSEESIFYSISISIFIAISSVQACKELQTVFNNKPIADKIKKQIIYYQGFL